MTRRKPALSRLWQQMLDAIPDLVIVLDLEHRILWLNSAMAARLKILRVEAIGSRCFQLLHDADQPPPGCPHCLLLNSGAPHTTEGFITGVEGVFLMSASPLRDSAGALIGSLHIARDITRRHQVEDELRRERDFTAAILEIIDALIVVLDSSGRIVNFNRACELLTGFSAGEVRGRHLWELLPAAEEREKIRDLLASPGQADAPGHHDIYWPASEGDPRLISWSKAAIHRPDGSLQYVIATGQDITERHLAEMHLARLAHYDLLTGLPNRKLYADLLQQAMARARRHRRLIGVLFLDLDHFKPVNDRFGHDTGDLLLAEVARRIRESVRETDTIGRMGGDEFIATIEGLKKREAAEPVARKILAALSRPFELAGQTCRIGVSIGMAFYPDDGAEMEILVKKADQAMYEAKKEGNTYRIYGR
jgi:diguanylate cyclase (GGDEF)-like protein/PAS domain S-box-containing protein